MEKARTDEDRYLDYLDACWQKVLDHMSEKKIALQPDRVEIYFKSLARPFYYWTGNAEKKPTQAPQDNARNGTGSSIPETGDPVDELARKYRLEVKGDEVLIGLDARLSKPDWSNCNEKLRALGFRYFAEGKDRGWIRDRNGRRSP